MKSIVAPTLRALWLMLTALLLCGVRPALAGSWKIIYEAVSGQSKSVFGKQNQYPDGYTDSWSWTQPRVQYGEAFLAGATYTDAGPAYGPIGPYVYEKSSVSAKGTFNVVFTWVPQYASIEKEPPPQTIVFDETASAQVSIGNAGPEDLPPYAADLVANNGLKGSKARTISGAFLSSGTHREFLQTGGKAVVKLSRKMEASGTLNKHTCNYGRGMNAYLSYRVREVSFLEIAVTGLQPSAYKLNGPDNKELDAYAKIGWRLGEGEEDPPIPFWEGPASYSVSEPYLDGASIFGKPQYTWSVKGAPLVEVDENSSAADKAGDKLEGSVAHKQFNFKLGNLGRTSDGNVDTSGFPKTTTVTAVVTGDKPEDPNLKGRVKVNWHMPNNLYRFSIKFAPEDDSPDAATMRLIARVKALKGAQMNAAFILAPAAGEILVIEPAKALMFGGLGLFRGGARPAAIGLLQKSQAVLKEIATVDNLTATVVVTVTVALVSQRGSEPGDDLGEDTASETGKGGTTTAPTAPPTTPNPPAQPPAPPTAPNGPPITPAWPPTIPNVPPATNPGAPPPTGPNPPPTNPLVPLPPVIPTQPGDGITNPPATNPTTPANPNPGDGTQPAPQPQPQPAPTNPPTDAEPPKPKVEYVVDSNVFMEGRTAILPYLNNPDVVIHLPEAAYNEVQYRPTVNVYRPVFAGGARITYLLENGTITKAPIILETDPDMTGIDLRLVADGGLISGNFGISDAKIVQTAKVLRLVLLSHNAVSLNNQIGSFPARKVLWGGVTIKEP